MTKRIYGYMKSGEPITDESIKAFALEAENGYSEEKLLTARRGRGRPRLGVGKKSVESVRLGPSLKSEAEQRALADGISVSEVIRRALKQYLHSA
jgi:predicted HicB family RNase H-like nuclease